MAEGTVKWFNETKRRGLITPDDGSKDLLVDYFGIDISLTDSEGYRVLKADQRVSFEVFQGTLGMQAINVKLV